MFDTFARESNCSVLNVSILEVWEKNSMYFVVIFQWIFLHLYDILEHQYTFNRPLHNGKKLIFKWSQAGLNSEFSFFKIGWFTKAKVCSLLYLPTAG